LLVSDIRSAFSVISIKTEKNAIATDKTAMIIKLSLGSNRDKANIKRLKNNREIKVHIFL
jgi:hypothetical protein